MSSAPFGEVPIVPIPAVYIDYVMPALTDTEWRILLVVIRQTIGWFFEEGGSPARKERDWLSHSQLKARTGKGGDAISRSIDSLVRYGLIVVEREDGQVVTSPQERRRVRNRLYYRLGQRPHPIRRIDPSGTEPQEGSTKPQKDQA